jgi:predicted transposase/invertase (TIGR01784 family)
LKESEKQLEKLPPIFPIMIYNGLAPWTAPSNISELIDNHELLGEFAVNFNYFKIAENEISVERLLELGNIVSTLFLGEVHFDSALLIEALSKLRKHEERQLVSMLFNFFEQLLSHGKLSQVGQEALNRVHTDEEMNMLLESMKIYQEKIYQQGRLEGVSEGERKGKLEGISEGERKGKLEIAKAMLNEGASVLFIERVTGLSPIEIEQLRH